MASSTVDTILPPHHRRGELIATFVLTLAIALFAVSRRLYVRTKKLSSLPILIFDYILLGTMSCYCIFTAFGLYTCLILRWEYQPTTSNLAIIWKIQYAGALVMDITMTFIRLDLFLQFRKLYWRVSPTVRMYCMVFTGLSIAYLLVCLIARSLPCGGAHPTAAFDFDAFSSSNCNDRRIRIPLGVGDFLLDCLVVFLFGKTMTVLRETERLAPKPAAGSVPACLLMECNRPCRVMFLIAAMACVIPLVHIKYAAAEDPYDYYSRVSGIICSQVEACVFIFISCMPMIRTLLVPALALPTSHPMNPRTRFASGSDALTGRSLKNPGPLFRAYRSLLIWALSIERVTATSADSKEKGVINKRESTVADATISTLPSNSPSLKDAA